MIIGYASGYSLNDLSMDMQLVALNKAGCLEIYKDIFPVTINERPQLYAMLNKLNKGDRLFVYKLDRICYSAKHLFELIDIFKEKEVEFVSIKDNIDTSTDDGRIFLRTADTLAKLERDITNERTQYWLGFK